MLIQPLHQIATTRWLQLLREKERERERDRQTDRQKADR